MRWKLGDRPLMLGILVGLVFGAVNLEYLKGAPLKIGVASAIGAFMGVVGGSLGWLASAEPPRPPNGSTLTGKFEGARPATRKGAGTIPAPGR